jgi:hypothetical protein
MEKNEMHACNLCHTGQRGTMYIKDKCNELERPKYIDVPFQVQIRVPGIKCGSGMLIVTR